MANTKITNPELFNLGDSTSATQLPVMTTTQRIAMNAVPILTVDYLVVAGGGGGSSGYGGSPQGGGGAGGLRTSYGLISGGGATAETSLSLTGGTVYALEVGAGGAGAPAQVDGNIGGSGGVSSFDAISTVGGGGSRSYLSSTPSGDGGSGGGQAYAQNGGPGAGTINQGYAGGSVTALGPGAGGGGAGSAGSWAASPTFGIGGDGVNVDITGSTVGYAGGGGRQVGTPRGGGGISFAAGNGPGGDGLPNTGGGGGGGRGNAGGEGGDGGSGVVVLRYPTADVASYTATGLTPTETTDGTDTILSFTTVGTGTITFTSSTPTGTISTGEMIFNSDTDKVEYWDGTKWYGITYEAAFPAGVQIAYSANDTASYPGTGTTWFDISGNSNDATLTNTTYSNGYLSFNGSSSKVTTSYTANPQNASFAAWVNCNNVSTYNNFISKGFYSGGSNTNYVFLVNYADARPKFTVRLNSNQRDCQSSVAMTNNTWHHVVGTVSSTGDMKIYLDGTQTGSQTGAPARNMTQSILSGVYLNGNQQFFSGEISKIQVYDTVLTATDVTDLYNAGSGTT
jgi:hypothetical protein